MTDLKAKIEALKYPRKKGEYGDACIYNAAIDRVLALIATHAAENAPSDELTFTPEARAMYHEAVDATKADLAPTDNTALVEAARAEFDKWIGKMDPKRGERSRVEWNICNALKDRVMEAIRAALQPAAPQPTPEVEELRKAAIWLLRHVNGNVLRDAGITMSDTSDLDDFMGHRAALARGSVAEKGESA